MASFKTGASSRVNYRFVVFLVTILALYASYSPPFQKAEGLLPDLAGRILPVAKSSGSVAVIAVDDASLNEYGVWPWQRDRLAAVVRRLQQFKPERIGFMLPLIGHETPRIFNSLQADLDSLDTTLRNKANAWLKKIDTDAQLAGALKEAGDVVLVAPYETGDQRVDPPSAPERFLLETTAQQTGWQQAVLRYLLSAPIRADIRPHYPPSVFLDSAAGAGVSEAYNANRYLSGTSLVFGEEDRYLSSFELSLFAGSKVARVTPGVGVSIEGQQPVAAPDLVYYPRPADLVPVYSLKQLMQDDSLKAELRNRILLLGLTAPALAPELTGPSGYNYTPVTWSAHILDSLRGGNAFVMPGWFYGVQRALVLLFALYLVFLPVCWHAKRAPLVSVLLAALALNVGLVALTVQGLWLPVAGPSVFLLLTQLVLTLAYRRHGKLIALRQEAIDARVSLGSNLHSQGQLELAMAQYVTCLPAPAALESLYELGLEYERRRQMQKAQAVYEKLEASSAGYRDSARRCSELSALSERFPGANGAAVNQTLVLDSQVMELPVLGRYRLERELGRGAMGTVYLAVDPAIARQVAIKTLSLLEHYEEREQEVAAQRFLKEAEAVGRLAHPHIVSIHDAGREHDVAYLVMDYVDGESLDAWVDKNSLLPVWEVLDIAAQLADGLDYAHSQKVIHRDVKPGNIIYDRDSGTVKITDFGVARILDSKQTRTGTVLGTPSYMSPEQVEGKKIKGQSDQFSLGVTLYQLLTGSLPFSGDSVATLMYQIANQKMPPLRKQRSGLPACVSRMVSRALHKDPARRFANGAEMAVAIRKCRLQFKGGRRKTA
jgi:serine/threonine-protein kinase